MSTDSQDETYNQLLASLRRRLKALAGELSEKVFEHAFLRR